VSEADLSSADGRWPAFSRRAVQAGYRSVQALPMRLRGQRLGALNLLRARPGPVPADHVRLGPAFADLATISIVSQRRAEERELLTGQLQQALDSRVVIERATGVVAGRTGMDVDQAFGVLRSAARRRSRRLSELAHDVVSGTVQVESLH
jgi:GAF domain-containing protein